MTMRRYFVTAIDTDSGKTFVSAILCEAFGADYWKPVQAGLPKDSDTVRNLISNSHTKIHPEKFLLNTPASPHAAAKIDGVKINVADFELPQTNNVLIIEGAGGCLVPLNDDELVIDLIKKLDLEVIVVADLYLGSINHTLLTFESLKSRSLPVKGIIFNGEPNKQSEEIILKRTGAQCLLNIQKEKMIDAATVSKYAKQLNKNMNG
jgi:dethiobiotin synthetase